MTGFETIRKRAARRKGGDDVLKRLLGPPADNRTVARLTDDRILSTMAERVFSAGFVWRVIRQKWPGFEEAFLGFEPKRLLFQPDDFWHRSRPPATPSAVSSTSTSSLPRIAARWRC